MTETTLYPTDDAFIWKYYPDTNYDEDALELTIYLGGGNDQKEILLKFDLSSIPEGDTITGVKLRLYKYDDRAVYTHSYVQLCKAADDDWAEDTVTWNLAPAEDGDLAQADTDEELGWKEWEDAALLAFIQAEFAGDKVVSFRINRDGLNLWEALYYHHRENATYKGQLVVTHVTPIAHTVTVTESLGMLDGVTKQFSAKKTITDSLGLLESQVPKWAAHLTISDELGLLESQVPKWAAHLTVSDKMGLVESTSTAAAFKQAITDVLGLSDIVGTAAAFKQAVTDIIGMLDSAARSRGFPITISEILGIRDRLVTRKRRWPLGDLPDDTIQGGA